jgi:Flp pilus assembly protein TadG
VRERSGRRGNALLEMAIVAIPLLGLLFSIVDFGLAIFIRTTLQHSVREGVRYAVTYGTSGGKCQDASIVEKVQNSSMGFLAGTNGASKVKVRYFSIDENNPGTFTEFAAGTGNAPGNIVEVAVEGYQYKWLAPIYWSAAPLSIAVRSSDRMEGLGAGVSPPCR